MATVTPPIVCPVRRAVDIIPLATPLRLRGAADTSARTFGD